mmetsp:Transcript_16609/g.47304  ORF Transcript_16609/g.47304 Transcript_16609/m.47304 type:complete len:91 (+) Transcript_16609:131-403(+)
MNKAAAESTLAHPSTHGGQAETQTDSEGSEATKPEAFPPVPCVRQKCCQLCHNTMGNHSITDITMHFLLPSKPSVTQSARRRGKSPRPHT